MFKISTVFTLYHIGVVHDFLHEQYLENCARAGQIGADGKLEGGRKGGLFYDVQNLSRVWNHPYILLKAKVI